MLIREDTIKTEVPQLMRVDCSMKVSIIKFFRSRVSAMFLLAMVLLSSAWQVNAQEGHPIKGSWIGEWQGNEAMGDFILLILDWDGENIHGMINPGTDNLEIDEATLNPKDWSVRIEAGDYVITGKFQNLELPSRSIVGNWRGPEGRGNFEIVRQ